MIYDYTIAPEADIDVFVSQCNMLEQNGYSRTEQLIDVDGSIVSYYRKSNTLSKIWLDYDVGAVYLQSDTPIERLLVNAPIVVKMVEQFKGES